MNMLVQNVPSFGQRIEAALVAGWNDAVSEGQTLLQKAEQFGEAELGVVEAAIVQTWGTYEPRAVALIAGYVKNALAQIGSGATIEQIAQSVIAQDATGASSFLDGALSAGLQAIVAGLIASL